jgi:hypothetical protein
MGTAIYNELAPFVAPIVILSGTGTGRQNFTSTLQSTARVDQMIASNSDVIDHVVKLELAFYSVYAIVASVNVPSGAGYNGVSPVDLVGSIPGNGPGLIADTYGNIAASVEVPVTLAYDVTIIGIGGTL